MLFWIGVITIWLSHMALKSSEKNLFFVITWTLGIVLALFGIMDALTF